MCLRNIMNISRIGTILIQAKFLNTLASTLDYFIMLYGSAIPVNSKRVYIVKLSWLTTFIAML